MPIIQRIAARLALLAIAAAFAACGSAAAPTPAPSPTAAEGLAGRAFLSVTVIDGGVDRPLVQGTRIRLDLRATDLTASAGCNSMGGQYRLDGGRLIVDQLATTDMGCPAPLGAQDAWLAKLLGASPTFVLDGNDLTLTAGSMVVRLQDRRVVQPDRALAGTLWTLDSIITGDVVSSVPSDTTATIMFKADGTLSVFTGCNQGGATWSQGTGGIVVTDLVLTQRACAGSGGPVEAALVGVLRAGTIRVTIEADTLTLQAGANGLGFRAS